MKYRWDLFASCLLLPLAFSTIAFAQEEAKTQKFWQAQAQEITDEIVKDTAALPTIDRSIVWAQLGDAWWKDDRERAQLWLQRAVEGAIFGPDQEPPADRKRRISTLRALLPILARHDEKLNTRLIQALLSLNESKDTQEESSANADALVNAALAIVKEQPRLAAALGSQSLRVGESDNFLALLVALRQQDGNIGDGLFSRLFRDALNTAQSTHSVNLLSSLVVAAFPKSSFPMYQGKVPPANVSEGLLAVLVEGLLTIQNPGAERGSDCAFARITAPLLNEIFQLFPQQAVAVRAEIGKCQYTSQRVDDALRDQPLKTVDDFLQAAEKEPNTFKAAGLLARAAALAAQQKDFNRAISILDGLSSEQRGVLGEAWEIVRVSFAAGAAIAYGDHKNYVGVEQVVAAVPSDLRPFVQIPVADSLLRDKGDNAFVFTLLEGARQRLAKLNQTDTERSKDRLIYSYLTLMQLYAKIDPSNGQYVLLEAISAINKVGTRTAVSEIGAQDLLKPFLLPVSLLEVDPLGIRQAVSSIDVLPYRISARLSLIKLSLEKMRSTRRPPTKKSGIRDV
jgi:hypothetical protein